jgi:DNA-binding transcriptional LysR family regulator
MVNDTGSLLGACLGGAGVAQLLEIYARDLIAQNRLVQLLPDWGDETFPLYAFHHSSNLVSAKVRAFLEFVRGLAS